MSFRITGLSPEPFRPLFGLSDEALAARGVSRHVADRKPCFPDRITLADAEIGETLLLLNHVHQPADTAYHASHAIFVREGAEAAYDRIDEIPSALRVRMLSLRGFDRDDMMVEAELIDGAAAESAIARLLSDPRIAYIQAHYAAPGCYAARIERA